MNMHEKYNNLIRDNGKLSSEVIQELINDVCRLSMDNGDDNTHDNKHNSIPRHVLSPVVCAMLVVPAKSFTNTPHIFVSTRSQNAINYPGKIQCPGGKLREMEDIWTGVAREVLEETGLDLDCNDFKHIATIDVTEPRGVYQVYIMYIVLHDYDIPRNTEPDKQTDWFVVDRHHLKQMSKAGECIPALDYIANILDTKLF